MGTISLVMQPPRDSKILAFVHWLAVSHPDIETIRDLDAPTFIFLAGQFEGEHLRSGKMDGDRHQNLVEWLETFSVFVDSTSDRMALFRLLADHHEER